VNSVVKKRTLYDAAGRSPGSLSAATRRAKIHLAHFRLDGDNEGTFISAPAQDAYLVIFQLHDHPAHEHWVDGRPAPAPLSPRGCLQIANMNIARSALLKGKTDSLHLHIPRLALDDLAEEEGVAAIPGLQVPKEWATEDRQLQQLQPLLLQTLESLEPPGRLFADHILLAATAHIATTYGEMRRPAPRGSGALAPWQVKRAKELLAANLAKEVSLRQVAEACGLSPAYFSRGFKIATRTTPHEWLQTCRVDRARDLMLDPRPSLAEIAIICGFADQSHFTRIFKRFTGLGPGAWRRLRRS
jgi:AraC family transcriptional regulator